MSNLTLTVLKETEAENVYNTYMKADFPKDELKPFEMIKNHMLNGIYICLGIFESNTLIGYAFCLTDSDSSAVLLDYFAILKEYRGSKNGSSALKKICRYFTEELSFAALILESENPDFSKNEQDKKTRNRRISFYEKNDMHRQSFTTDLFGVKYCIFSYPKTDAKSALISIYKKMLPKKHFESRLRIYEG